MEQDKHAYYECDDKLVKKKLAHFPGYNGKKTNANLI